MFWGTNGEKVKMITANGNTFSGKFEGIIPNLYRRHENAQSDFVRNEIEKYMVSRNCGLCKGKRLNNQALSVNIAGKSIIDVTDLNILLLSPLTPDIHIIILVPLSFNFITSGITSKFDKYTSPLSVGYANA